jgi:hypothetical protein
MLHSRPRSWLERIRRQLSRRTPFRCHACGCRVWRADVVERVKVLREVHRALTDAELERLEPDSSEGDRM